MKISYEVGTKIWVETGNLSSKEKVSLITTMETNIIRNKKAYQDEYFYWLTISFEELRNDARTFMEFKEYNQYIDWLEWLRRKNLTLIQKQKFNGLVDQVREKIPVDQVNELIDAYEELTGYF